METRLTWVVVIMITLTTATAAVPLGSSGVASGATTSSTCDQEVRHDAFRETEAIESVNQTGEATSRVQNTKVRVKDVTGFVRLHAENPNGYCVRYVVEISPEIVSPADLGTVSSNDEEHEASWRAAQNLSTGEVRTRVEFSLPSGSNATFAPSSVRVESLSWTGAAKRKGNGALDGLREWWGTNKLDQREYVIEPTSDSSRITVQLTKDGERIEEWQATYELDGKKRVVTQDARKPVYYTENRDTVTFHFSDRARDAKVTFMAEPTPVDKVRFSADSYLSGLSEGSSLIDKLPFTVVSPRVIAS